MQSIIAASAAAFAVSLVGLVHPVFASSEGNVADSILSMEGEFEVSNGDRFVLMHKRTPTEGRICVKDVPGVIPLKVTVDGESQSIVDGRCSNVIGKHIEVAPGAKLASSDDVLLGRFERVKK